MWLDKKKKKSYYSKGTVIVLVHNVTSRGGNLVF